MTEDGVSAKKLQQKPPPGKTRPRKAFSSSRKNTAKIGSGELAETQGQAQGSMENTIPQNHRKMRKCGKHSGKNLKQVKS